MTQQPEPIYSNIGVTILDTRDILIALLIPSEFQREIYGEEPVDEALAHSLVADGQLQPVLVWAVRTAGGELCGYEIVSGHRRVAAARVIGWETVRCEVAEWVDDKEIRRRIAVSTNTQRRKTVRQMVAECVSVGAFGKITSSESGALVLRTKNLTTRETAEIMGGSHVTIGRLCKIFDETYQIEQLAEIPDGAHERMISDWEDIRYACMNESEGAGILESAKAVSALVEWGKEWKPGGDVVKPKKEKPSKFELMNEALTDGKQIYSGGWFQLFRKGEEFAFRVNTTWVRVNVDELADDASRWSEKVKRAAAKSE
jgi:ParB-like chromosome segregation protein Spo0J